MLISRVHGRRPVTLVGFSMGARVIYYCLKEMAARREYGIVENGLNRTTRRWAWPQTADCGSVAGRTAYLIGAPVTADAGAWAALVPVVAGRIVNAYCQSDWVLAILCRTMSVELKYAESGFTRSADWGGWDLGVV